MERIMPFVPKKFLIIGLVVFSLCALIAAALIWGLPKLTESFFNQGVNYFTDKNYIQASRYFKTATVLSPKNGEYFAHLGYTYHRQKDQRAEEAYLKALSLNYETPLFYSSLGLFYQDEKKDYNLAIQYYQKSIDLSPKEYVFAYDNLITLFLRLNRNHEAISIAEKLTQIFPQSAQAFFHLGLAYSRSFQFKESEAAFQKAIQLEPNNPAWFTGFAEMLVIKGDTDRAIQEYEKALNIDPLYSEALCKITYIFAFKKLDYKKVISYASTAIQEKPNSKWLPICFYNLGYAFLNLGNKTEAKLSFEDYLKHTKGLSEDNYTQYTQKYIQDVENKLKELSL